MDHLHEHFVDPCVVKDAHYVVPQAPGYSITMKPRVAGPLRVPRRRGLAQVVPRPDEPEGAVAEAAPARTGHVRWVVCALLFFATTLNYIDRQVLGILAPDLQKIIGWSEVQYGYIVTAFQAAYAIGLLLVGRLLDVVGTRHGFAFALIFWSVAAMAHALARTPLGFGMARFALGLGEAGNFPAAIKTVAEWFPRKERALATGIFNAGSNVGAVDRARGGAVHRAVLRVAGGVPVHGRHRVRVADLLVLALPPAGGAPEADGGRAAPTSAATPRSRPRACPGCG